MNRLQKIEKDMMDSLNIKIPYFRSGCTISVFTKIIDGEKERIQKFEGVCIKRRNAGIASSFTVRKMSNDVSVEKTFMLYSKLIDKLEVIRFGKVRRAKLYYLRERLGKSAKLKEVKNYQEQK